MKETEDNSASEKSQEILMEVEKELWESGDWRENIKDLNSSFSAPVLIFESKIRM